MSRSSGDRGASIVSLLTLIAILSGVAIGVERVAPQNDPEAFVAAVAALSATCDGRPRGKADEMCPDESASISYACLFPGLKATEPKKGSWCSLQRPCEEIVSGETIRGHCVSPKCCHADTAGGKPLGDQPKLPDLPKSSGSPSGKSGSSQDDMKQSAQAESGSANERVGDAFDALAEQESRKLDSDDVFEQLDNENRLDAGLRERAGELRSHVEKDLNEELLRAYEQEDVAPETRSSEEYQNLIKFSGEEWYSQLENFEGSKTSIPESGPTYGDYYPGEKFSGFRMSKNVEDLRPGSGFAAYSSPESSPSAVGRLMGGLQGFTQRLNSFLGGLFR